ncbi:MAG TPA: methyltransferase domain-containing protein [Solirubrobacteraceae bacterium]|nr:methyltransferase domain-containing protein [Solirubrobacteraceae bacterium]
MQPRLLDFIACPDCGADLTVRDAVERDPGEVYGGRLACERCAAEWPIVRGIPRFIDGVRSEDDLRDVYADSFGHQWTTFDWLRDEDELEFFRITDLTPAELEGKVVLDAGCGGGRLSRVVAPYCGELFGFDYSIAVDKAYELCRGSGNAHFVQCDVNRHPFRDGAFDLVYSHGVLHHTPDTKRSFDNLPRLVKEGGRLYVALFRRAFKPLQLSDRFWRAVVRRLPVRVQERVCEALGHLNRLPRPVFWKRFFWFSMQPTPELRKYCNYDWYAPRYHHEHTAREVMGWFEAAGFPDPTYINAWPYCPPELKYAVPGFRESFRLGQLLGVIGTRAPAGAEGARARSSSGIAEPAGRR